MSVQPYTPPSRLRLRFYHFHWLCFLPRLVPVSAHLRNLPMPCQLSVLPLAMTSLYLLGANYDHHLVLRIINHVLVRSRPGCSCIPSCCRGHDAI
ncbi:hypothetical protein BJV74DRAFT_108658 [Russula compacta]|nr:hypothetical protein BJV74DRAFT_108658 [Russula compacta]